MQTLNEFRTGLAYHDSLNPALWSGEHLIPIVQVALERIAANFIEFTGIDRSKVKAVVITGSNCNYNYSPFSDIDLHVVADYDEDHRNEAGISVQGAFNAYKTLYNETHHIKVHGVPIEVYVQPTTEHFTSNAGVYSLTKKQWIQHPVKVHVELDDREIQRKAKPIIQEINTVVHGKMANSIALPKIRALKTRIQQLRAAGLQAGGEFGVENLAFKALRNAGYLDKLWKYSEAIGDATLSLL